MRCGKRAGDSRRKKKVEAAAGDNLPYSVIYEAGNYKIAEDLRRDRAYVH